MENSPLLDRAWLAPASPTQRFTLLALASSTGSSGRTGITVPDLVERTGFTERTVQRAIRDLERLGHVTRIHATGIGVVTSVHPQP